jgi:hypothetical protein
MIYFHSDDEFLHLLLFTQPGNGEQRMIERVLDGQSLAAAD